MFTLKGTLTDHARNPLAKMGLIITPTPARTINEDGTVTRLGGAEVNTDTEGRFEVELATAPGLHYTVRSTAGGRLGPLRFPAPQEPDTVVDISDRDRFPAPAPSPLSEYVRGASAYEVWLAAGNEGSVDDYHESLRGAPGPEGGTVGATTRVVPSPIPNFAVPVTIHRHPTGWSADVDLETLHSRGSGPTIYVDPINGTLSGDGLTPSTAAPSVVRAHALGAAEIILRGGIYPRGQADGLLLGRRDVIARSYPGERAVLTTGDAVAWTLHSGSTYQTAPLSGYGAVVHRTAKTPAGLPYVPRIVATQAEVLSTPGTAHHDGTRFYVHLEDGSNPNGQVLACRPTYILDTASTNNGSNGAYSILLDGVSILGGRQVARLRDASGAGGSILLCRDSDFMWGEQNGLAVEGFSRTALVGCRAWQNGIDGFNYHALNGVDGDAVEINCSGRLNGRFSSSQNGSTTHGAWRIVRVGGTYDFNGGPNVADVNDTWSANFGVRAGDAWATPAEQVDFTIGARLWLIDCYSSSPIAIRSESGRVEVSSFVRTGEANVTLHPYA